MPLPNQPGTGPRPVGGPPQAGGGGGARPGQAVAPTPASSQGGLVADAVISEIPGLAPFDFGASNLGASQTAVALHRTVPAATPTGAQIPVVVPFRGSIAALTFSANANKTAGTASFTVYKNGVATAATVAWSDSTDKGYQAFARNLVGFLAGDEIDVRVTTDGSYSPTTTEVIVTVLLSQDPSTVL